MQLTAYSYPIQWARELEACPENTCIISINDTGDPNDVEFLFRSEHIHKFRINDIICPFEHNGHDYKPIDEITTRVLVDTIHKNTGRHFAIHCHAGVSRSGAVALYIHAAYGHALRPDFVKLSHPNPLILGMLLRAHIEKGWSIAR